MTVPPQMMDQGPWTSRTNRHLPLSGPQGVDAGRFAGAHSGPNPTDCRKKGCKRHILTDAHGTRLVVHITPAKLRDWEPGMVDRMPNLAGPRRRGRRRPEVLAGDRAHGTPGNVPRCHARGIHPISRKPGTAHRTRFGCLRYVVAWTHVWSRNRRRLKVCYERNEELFQALHGQTGALICARTLGSLASVLKQPLSPWP